MSLYGGPAWLRECDAPRIRKILRDSGAVSDGDQALAAASHDELLRMAKQHGLGPGVPDEWTLQKKKADMQAEAEQRAEVLSPRSRGRLRAANRRKPTPVVGGSPKYVVAGERRFKPPPAAATRSAGAGSSAAGRSGRASPLRRAAPSAGAAPLAQQVMSAEHIFTDGVDTTSEGTCTSPVARRSSRSEANTEDLEAEAEAAAEAVVAAEAMLKAARLRAASVAAKTRSLTGDAATPKEQGRAKSTAATTGTSKAGGKKKHIRLQASPVRVQQASPAPQHGQAVI